MQLLVCWRPLAGVFSLLFAFAALPCDCAEARAAPDPEHRSSQRSSDASLRPAGHVCACPCLADRDPATSRGSTLPARVPTSGGVRPVLPHAASDPTLAPRPPLGSSNTPLSRASPQIVLRT